MSNDDYEYVPDDSDAIFADVAIQHADQVKMLTTYPVQVSVGMAESARWPDGCVVWFCALHLDLGLMTEREFYVHVKETLAEHQASIDHCRACGGSVDVAKDPRATAVLQLPFPCVVIHDNGNRTPMTWPGGGTVSWIEASAMCISCLERQFNYYAHCQAKENIVDRKLPWD